MLQQFLPDHSKFKRHALAVAVSIALTAPISAYAGGEVVQFVAAAAAMAEGNVTHATTHAVRCSGGQVGSTYGGGLTVSFATAGLTAVSGTDFTASTGTLTFSNIECQGVGTSKNIPVDVLGDLVVESDETFSITLSNLVNNISSGSGPQPAFGANTLRTVTLLNDDHALSIANLSQVEGDVGTSNFNVAVTCSGNTNGYGGPVTVNYATGNGTASAGTDFTATSSTLNFTSAECDVGTIKNIPVVVQGNTIPEPNKTFSVTLSAPGGASIQGSASATVTIVNDDLFIARAVPTLSTGVLAALGGLLALLGTLVQRCNPVSRRRKDAA